ncbi:MAG: polysaccharide pyruvyl transferase family protein [Opitutales bacterium]|nr:polysaccharide pyruvyl transferase family protein [Opitutales bacterium]NRA27196.1 polysaccharide pyruvyl transferase family protein [Opitutales bacterium]
MKSPPHFAIVGAAFSGNKGAEAMLVSTIIQMQRRYPGAVIHVLSYFPSEDLTLPRRKDVYIHSATPKTLVLKWLPIGILLKLLPFFKKPAVIADRLPITRLLTIDAVFDIFGVSFMDSRLKFLPFNLFSVLPFLLHQVPVFKLSQALGPFRKWPNRAFARWTLGRMEFTAARGAQTLAMLQELPVRGSERRLIEAADIAFLLGDRSGITEVPSAQTLALIPSLVVDQKVANYQSTLCDVAKALADAGWTIRVITHSWRSDGNGPRNHDPVVAEPIVRRLSELGVEASLLGPGLDSEEIRAEIGKCSVVLTSRFHGLIAALATARPVAVVGWSHKYREVLAPFGLEEFCIPYQAFDAPSVLNLVERCESQAEEIRSKILDQLAAAQRSARSQFDEVMRRLEERS